MAFNQQEQEIIKWGLENKKSRQDVEKAITNFRLGIKPEPREEVLKEPTFWEDVEKSLVTRADKFGEIEKSDAGTVEKAVQKFGQGAGLGADVIEGAIMRVPVVKEALGKFGEGIRWLETSEMSPIKHLGDKIGSTKVMQELVNLYDTDKNFKNTVDGVANIVRLGGDVEGVVNSPKFAKNVTQKVYSNVKNSSIGAKVADVVETGVTKVKEVGNKALGLTDEHIAPKALSIFTGEETSAVKKALEFPDEADLGIKNGDQALREAIKTGADESVKAKQTFITAQRDAFQKLAGENSKIKIKQKNAVSQFTDSLQESGVKMNKKGEFDFTTSKIVANAGEMGKIKTAYDAILAWDDWSVAGTNELKQLIGQLTKFANEGGGSSKSPFLGKYYKYLDEEIKNALPEEARTAYTDMNKKFSDSIDLYDEMVDAFNSGDPFSRLSQLFSTNKDTLRQIVEFYENTTGNKISPIVAGRTLAQSKNAPFGFLNPRQWVDFFIPPEYQARVVTSVGRARKAMKEKGAVADEVIENTPANTPTPTATPVIDVSKNIRPEMKKGTFLNIGLKKGTTEELLTKQGVLKVLEERGMRIVKNKVQNSDTEPTLVVQLDKPLTEQQMLELASVLDQEAIPQLVNGKGALYGSNASAWGDFNPEYFLDFDGNPIFLPEPLTPPKGRAKGKLQKELKAREAEAGI